MNTKTAAAYAPALYGAYELKQGYQRAMLGALILAVLGHLSIMESVLLYKGVTPGPTGQELPPGPNEADGHVIVLNLPPPPSLPMVETEPSGIPGTLPKLGTFIPTPDADVVEEPVFRTLDRPVPLHDLLLTGSGVGSGTGGGEGDLSNFMGATFQEPATPSGLTAEATPPVLVHSEEPEYPDLAVLTQTSGSVLIEALVDEEGKVRKARVGQASGVNAGFDMAAVDAAYKNRYKPAIQNGRPVATWIVYRVEFKIKR